MVPGGTKERENIQRKHKIYQTEALKKVRKFKLKISLSGESHSTFNFLRGRIHCCYQDIIHFVFTLIHDTMHYSNFAASVCFPIQRMYSIYNFEID